MLTSIGVYPYAYIYALAYIFSVLVYISLYWLDFLKEIIDFLR
jgi:hypothetical protein